ncbi:MAG: YeeE/YedE family protein [Albidovulum sp.]
MQVNPAAARKAAVARGVARRIPEAVRSGVGEVGIMPIEWLWGAAGGVMIGIAAAIFLLANGRIMGASTILGSVVDGTAVGSLREKLVFIAALVAVPAIAAPLLGRAATHATSSIAVLVVAGLAVGIGTRLANGCTSGHGVCGIPRLSVRSIVATLIYIGTGALTVLVARHVLGFI